MAGRSITRYSSFMVSTLSEYIFLIFHVMMRMQVTTVNAANLQGHQTSCATHIVCSLLEQIQETEPYLEIVAEQYRFMRIPDDRLADALSIANPLFTTATPSGEAPLPPGICIQVIEEMRKALLRWKLAEVHLYRAIQRETVTEECSLLPRVHRCNFLRRLEAVLAAVYKTKMAISQALRTLGNDYDPDVNNVDVVTSFVDGFRGRAVTYMVLRDITRLYGSFLCSDEACSLRRNVENDFCNSH